MRKPNWPTVVAWELTLAIWLIAAALWWHLPDNAPVPQHWNARGEVDHWSTPWPGLFVLPLIWTFTLGILHMVSQGITSDPKARGARQLIGLVTLAVSMLFLMLQIYQGMVALHARVPPLPPLLIGSIGLLHVIIGNGLGKVGPNHLVGARNRWSLSDPDVWERTQRFAGRAFVLIGFITIALALSPVPDIWQIGAAVTMPLLVAVLTTWRSYQLARDKIGTGTR